MRTRIKICGFTRIDDALTAAALGADALGFVFYARSPRFIVPSVAGAIVRALPPFVASVALFVDPTGAEVDEVLREVGPDVLQFHGDEPPEFCARFGRPYMKAARVRAGLDLLQYARTYAAAKALLLDAYVPEQHGGTGHTFDWSLIPSTLPLPLVLSGGLTAETVAGALRRVRPWAVDVSSGVETAKGIKDASKVARFITGVRNEDLRSA